MPPISNTTIPERKFLPANAEIRAAIQPEGLVLLHIRKGMFYRANHVGARIWEKLSTGASLDKVIDQIADEFGVPVMGVAPDVFEFVESLVNQGFLQAKEIW